MYVRMFPLHPAGVKLCGNGTVGARPESRKGVHQFLWQWGGVPRQKNNNNNK